MRKMKFPVLLAVWCRLVSFASASRVLALAVALVLAIPARTTAAILASDNFESYAPGNNNLQTQNGGTGWTAGWLAPGSGGIADVRDTTANPLAFTPYGGSAINGATRAAQCWNA
jgi:hypothetical protein